MFRATRLSGDIRYQEGEKYINVVTTAVAAYHHSDSLRPPVEAQTQHSQGRYHYAYPHASHDRFPFLMVDIDPIDELSGHSAEALPRSKELKIPIPTFPNGGV